MDKIYKKAYFLTEREKSLFFVPDIKYHDYGKPADNMMKNNKIGKNPKMVIFWKTGKNGEFWDFGENGPKLEKPKNWENGPK